MPPSDRLNSIFTLALEPRHPLPLFRGWSRLEGRPRVADFERSLRAEIRDPLWFLTRQWQFGEFQGEDAASPIDVAAGVRSAPLATLRIGSDEAVYDPSVPLETRVEREPAPFDLTLHMQASRYLARLLAQRGIPGFLSKFVAQWPLTPNSLPGEPGADTAGLQAAGAAFLFDTAALLAGMRDGTFAAAVATMTGNLGQQTLLAAAGAELRKWFDRCTASRGSNRRRRGRID